MAEVLRLVATDRGNPGFDEHLIDGSWHATYIPDAWRTVCGVQLEGDDGIGPGSSKQGRVTCDQCRNILEQIQSIKSWR